MQNVPLKARYRLQQVRQSLQLSCRLATVSAMQAPKVRRISPLPPGEAKWTELNKIEVGKSVNLIVTTNTDGFSDISGQIR